MVSFLHHLPPFTISTNHHYMDYFIYTLYENCMFPCCGKVEWVFCCVWLQFTYFFFLFIICYLLVNEWMWTWTFCGVNNTKIKCRKHYKSYIIWNNMWMEICMCVCWWKTTFGWWFVIQKSIFIVGGYSDMILTLEHKSFVVIKFLCKISMTS